jgi:hypothetical protein
MAVTPKEEHRLKVLENRAANRIWVRGRKSHRKMENPAQ